MHQLATIESPIEAVTIEESGRPFWSVMIPTYNRPDYLKETLLSVLSQDPGSDKIPYISFEVVS